MRLRLRDSISLYRAQVADNQFKTTNSFYETHSVDSSDIVSFKEDTIGITIFNNCKDAPQEVFVPWSNVRSFERDIKVVSNKKMKKNA